MSTVEADRQAVDAVASVELWYHTMDLAPGVVTPGWFDLRSVSERLPWPDVRGKRCLDVGPWDGFFAFELERRGAAEVIAADIGSHTAWDWPAATRELGPTVLKAMAGDARPGAGFGVAKSVLNSAAERLEISAYDLSPGSVGEFDVIVCGDLMLHLRDPVRALEAIRSVCRGHFLSAELIDPWTTLIHPRRPVAAMRGGDNCQWWLPNRAGHATMVKSAGFTIERQTRPYAVPVGPAHAQPARAPRQLMREALAHLITGRAGKAHAALLARPA